MMDRLSHRLRRTIAEMFVVGALIGCAWVAGNSVDSPQRQSPTAPGGSEIELLPPASIQPPRFLGEKATARWLPPLSSETREVLTAVCPDKLPPANQLAQNHVSPGDISPMSRTEPWQSADDIGQLPRLTGPAQLGDQFQPEAADRQPQANTPPRATWTTNGRTQGDAATRSDATEEDVANNDRLDDRPDTAADETETLEDSTGASLLLPPQLAANRSQQLERIARQADKKIRNGYELAGRGAHFAARAEFIAALRLLAQGLDTERNTTIHSRSLAAGLTAIKEVGDFIPSGSRLEAHLDIAALVDSHATPVLKNTDTDKLTSLSAVKCYLTFAQEQLGVAAGHEVAASMALHAMGKLHGVLPGAKAPESKAVTFYQASLMTFPQNYMASNDLGVLLAKSGNNADAHAALLHSLSICPQASGWHNLSVVYRQQGREADARQADLLAAQARKIEESRRKNRSGHSNQLVRWVDPATFAGSLSRRPATGRNMPLRTASSQQSNKRK